MNHCINPTVKIPTFQNIAVKVGTFPVLNGKLNSRGGCLVFFLILYKLCKPTRAAE